MEVTVGDITNLDIFRNLRLIAGKDGLDRRIQKVGILDFEFTRLGSRQCIDEHWAPNEFVLSTFLYARESPNLITDAIKKLASCNTSGLAIKNIFSIEIPKEAIRFANANNYPLFIFIDNSIFFEDLIVHVSNRIKAASSEVETERKLHAIIKHTEDKSSIKQAALGINPALENAFFVAYYSLKPGKDEGQLISLFSRVSQKNLMPISSSLLKYDRGFFFAHSAKNPQSIDIEAAQNALSLSFNIKKEDYYIGISEVHYYLTNYKKALTQSLQVTDYCKIHDLDIAHYHSLGIYRILLPSVDEEWVEDYYNSYIVPILEFDTENKSDLLEMVLAYEQCQGNIKDIAFIIGTHENTARYRLSKIKEILQFSDAAKMNEELSMAAKIYRIKDMHSREASM